jgi:CHASE2 domain-containing sensor protein
LLLRHSPRLALAAAWTDDGDVIGVEALDPLVGAALGPGRAGELFGFVNSPPDADGVVRWAHAAYADVRGVLRPTLAGRLAALGGDSAEQSTARVLMNTQVDWGALERWSWLDLERHVAAGARLDDRLVIVGADFAGSGDLHRIAVAGGGAAVVPGLLLQARLADALSNPGSITAAAGWVVWTALGLLIVPAVLLTLVGARVVLAAAALALGMALWLAAATVAWWSGHAIPVASAMVATVGAIAAALAIRGSLGPVPR